MEEKLYFKPGDYGKGIKKEKQLGRNTSGETNSHRVRNLVLFLIFLIIIVLVILWLLRGKTTTSGQYPANIRTESLKCTSSNISYDKIGVVGDSAVQKELSLTFLFQESGELNSVSLKDTLTFTTPNEAVDAEAIAHATFNKGLAARGYDSGKFSNKFSVMDNKFVVTLHNNSQFDDDAKEYFLLNSDDELKDLSDYSSFYKNKGFVCETTKN